GTVASGTTLGGFVKIGSQVPPPAPKQSGPDTIAFAADERPTDAVWRANHLWAVATDACTWDQGATTRACARVIDVQTSPSVAVAQDMLIGEAGYDAFSGGIGLSLNGTTFVTWARSNASGFVDTLAAHRVPADAPDSLSTPIMIAQGKAAYAAERWGDFSGVAFDPAGTGAAWTGAEYPTSDGAWGTRVSRLVFDTDAPSTVTPSQAIVVPSSLSGTAAIRLSWPASSDATSGVALYEVAQNIDGSGFETITSSASSTSIGRRVAYTAIGGAIADTGCSPVQYEVRAMDGYGNTGVYQPGSILCPQLYQTSSGVTYSSGWHTSSGSAYSAGSTRYASTAGNSASFKVTARNVAIVSTLAKSRGSFKVYVDGALKATVSTYSSTTRYRQVVWQFGWSTRSKHTIKIVIKGTSRHPRVDFDAILRLY
ncbi:MAG TPA: hypothetical protein VMT36_04815, partial [Candidatus Saccharimonadia bacterium]|nr:hypothetical protein [Candidatus Saccharimonadia bacterium]